MNALSTFNFQFLVKHVRDDAYSWKNGDVRVLKYIFASKEKCSHLLGVYINNISDQFSHKYT